MKFKEWRLREGLTLEDAASLLEVAGPGTIVRYEMGRVPERKIMQRIIELTHGDVTANDFFDVSGEAEA